MRHSPLCYDEDARLTCVCDLNAVEPWRGDLAAQVRALLEDVQPCPHESREEPCGQQHVSVDAVWNLEQALKSPAVRRGVDRWESASEEAQQRIDALLDDDPVRISGLDR